MIPLGENDQLVLLAVAHLGSDGYGMTIRREIERRTTRVVSIATVYAALDRLEFRGLIVSRTSAPIPVRGGRSRRHFTLTQSGAEALVDSRRVMERMWGRLRLDPDGETA